MEVHNSAQTINGGDEPIHNNSNSLVVVNQQQEQEAAASADELEHDYECFYLACQNGDLAQIRASFKKHPMDVFQNAIHDKTRTVCQTTNFAIINLQCKVNMHLVGLSRLDHM